MCFKNCLVNICVSAALICAVSACDSGEKDYGEPPDLSRFHDTVIGDCPPYTESDVFRGRGSTIVVYPESNWTEVIEDATPDTEILLAAGDYLLDVPGVAIKSGVTVRGLSGDRDSVRIQGLGYGVEAEGFIILGDDITVADLSISNIKHHAVTVNSVLDPSDDFQLFNVDIKDIGTQHVKVNPGGAQNGLIACSRLGYSEGAAVGDYNSAIDLHGAIDWTLRDNYIYNITGDGSGCIIDQYCGEYISEPAILVWNYSQGTRVIGNIIVDSYRNIALGLGTSHVGGEVLHNTIWQNSPGDAGIELFGVSDMVVEFNRVELSGEYPGSIEYRTSNNLTITNNWLSHRPWDRGGNQDVQLSGNSYSR